VFAFVRHDVLLAWLAVTAHDPQGIYMAASGFEKIVHCLRPLSASPLIHG